MHMRSLSCWGSGSEDRSRKTAPENPGVGKENLTPVPAANSMGFTTVSQIPCPM